MIRMKQEDYEVRLKEILESMGDREIELPEIVKTYQLIRFLPNTFLVRD